MSTLKIIGRKDIIDLPSIGILNIAVKIDSGAYSSSIHCSSFELIEKDGESILEVVFLDELDERYTGNKIHFKQFKKKKVKSSNGMQQERFFVKLDIQIFNEIIQTDFSLTKRNGLRSPILLGRKLLNKRFLIDSSKINLSYKSKQ